MFTYFSGGVEGHTKAGNPYSATTDHILYNRYHDYWVKCPIGKWSGQCGRTTQRRCMAVLHDPESSLGRY